MISFLLPLLAVATLKPAPLAAVGCSLRNPDQDIQRFFPTATDYLVNYVSFENQAPDALSNLEQLLGEPLDPVYETSDVPYTLYTVYSGQNTLGYVFGTNQRGTYSTIQIIAIVDASLELKTVYLQTLRSPAFEAFQSAVFLEALSQFDLVDFSTMARCYRDKECSENPVSDPTNGQEPEDYRHILRGLSKLHGVQTLLLHPGAPVTPPSLHAQAEWIGNHQGVDLPRQVEDQPRFIPLSESDLEPHTPVLAWRHHSGLRVYPLDSLHETPVVHDTVSGQRVAITWSSPSSTAAVLGLNPDSPGFQPTGDLLFRNRVLVDRGQGSPWNVLSGTALYGPSKGAEVQHLSGAHLLPRRAILNEEAALWVSSTTSAPTSAPLAPTEGVLLLQGNGENPAWKLGTIHTEDLIHQTLGEVPVILASVGDSAVAWGRDIGGEVLSFERCATGGLCDTKTGSRFSLASGRAVSGPLTGQALPAIISMLTPINAWASTFPGERLDGQRE
ncbi:MAG: DUF3179 domain-containing (seleno)protein [Myxococcota bacterium]|nr:DUF3179 domain-containing (seleno)protein [Myxococcota bacterium]